MAAFVQVEEGNLSNGPRPPLKELFLEIQIQKLIQEYLFSSNAGEMRRALPEVSSEHKQLNKKPEWIQAAESAALQSASNAPFVKSEEAFDVQNPNDPCSKPNSQASATLHSITCIEGCGMDGTEDQTRVSANALLAADRPHEASLASLSVESGEKVEHKIAHLSRAGTFPWAGSVHLQAGMPTKAKTEIKASCKKPPRPPKPPKSELGLSLTRCSSDNSGYLQSIARRVRKRKAITSASASASASATSASVSTSIYAVLFTLCFAIIIIAQGSGFWSQNSPNFSTDGSTTSSSTQTLLRASSEQSAEEDLKSAQAAERLASTEGLSTGREASSGGAMARSYVVVRKAQLQPPSSHRAFRV